MKVIMKCPGENVKIGELAVFNDIRDFIGGCFETVPLLCSNGSKYLIVCNDSFLLDGSKFNMSLGGVQIFGNFFICGLGQVYGEYGEYDFVGLNHSDILSISDNLCWSDDDRAILKAASSKDGD